MGKVLKNDIKKLNKIPHPKGRKTSQLSKKIIKASAREKSKLLNHMKTNLIGERLLWFRENLEPVESYSSQLLMKLIESYLGRFNNELQQIRLKHTIGKRKGRQHANREDIIKMTISNEENEYNTCGLEMVDILNPDQLNLLRNWSGELRYLQNFKWVRFNKQKLLEASNFNNCELEKKS